jgi:DNA anti-recombination protein RmuC
MVTMSPEDVKRLIKLHPELGEMIEKHEEFMVKYREKEERKRLELEKKEEEKQLQMKRERNAKLRKKRLQKMGLQVGTHISELEVDE